MDLAFPVDTILAAYGWPTTLVGHWHSELFLFTRLARLPLMDGLAKLDRQAPAWQRGDLALVDGELVRLVRPLYPQTHKLPYGHPQAGQPITITAWVIAHALDHRWAIGTVFTYNLDIVPGSEEIFESRAAAEVSEETFGGAPAERGRYLPGWEAFVEAGREDSRRTDADERRARYEWRHSIPQGPHHFALVQRETKRTHEHRGQALYIDGFLALSSPDEMSYEAVATLLRERYAIIIPSELPQDLMTLLGLLVNRGWYVPGWLYVVGRRWFNDIYDLERASD